MLRSISAVLVLVSVMAAEGVSAAETEAERLSRFKFEPIEMVAAAKRDLRRISIADIFDEDSLPGLTFERKPSGEVDLTVVSDRGKTIDAATLKAEAWEYLRALEDRAFAPTRPASRPSSPICIGDRVVLEATYNGAARRREGAFCGGATDQAAMDYGRRAAEIALAAIPRCAGFDESTREPMAALRHCLKYTSRGAERSSTDGARRAVALTFVITTTRIAQTPVVRD